MADEKPFSAWQQCKQISEALSPKPLSAEEAEQRVRGALLAQLAATGEHGAAMAARLVNTDGPIQMEPGDIETLEEMKKRIAEKTGIKDANGHFAVSLEFLSE